MVEFRNPEDYPVSVTLRFKSRDELEDFLGGYLDGWGEGVAEYDLSWNWTKKMMSASLFDTFFMDKFEEE